MIKHIMIDIVKSDEKTRVNIVEILKKHCTETLNVETLGVSVFKCNSVLVEVKSHMDCLLLDLIGEADYLFDEIAKVLPRANVMVRLIERGS